MYKIVKRYYDTGRYSKEDVAKFVKAGRITREECEKITGEAYEE